MSTHRALPRLILLLLLWPLSLGAQDAIFPVDRLNSGLPAPAASVDRDTPQAALESFLDLVKSGDLSGAAHVLNLNDIPADQQALTGPLLADRLATIIDRKVVIDWADLLERPDAMMTTGDGAMVGQAQKSILIGILERDDRMVALRLNRLQAGEADPVWVFSRDSVDNIPALYALYGPSRMEEALPAILRQPAFWGMQWWEVIGLPIIVLIAASVALSTWRGLNMIARHQPSPLVSELIRATRLPGTLTILALTVSLTTSRVFAVSGIVDAITEPLTVILYVVAIMILAINVIDATLQRLTVALDVDDLASPEYGDQRAQATTVAALRRMAIVLAIIVGAALVLTATPAFSGAGLSVLVSAGGLALVLGFAAREVLGNIMASLQISLNRSAKVGDQLVYDDYLCTVERIHFTYVQLKVWDDTRLIVPVSKFISDAFINRSTRTYGMLRNATLILAPQIDVTRLRDHFRDWCEVDDRVDGDPEDISCVVVGQGDSGMHVRFAAPIKDPTVGWDFECDIREEMLGFAAGMEREDDIPYLPRMGIGSPATGEGNPG
ncbi:mechanosensitive ion channel family protein [Loktanella sp. DJP18]|uniref:mechanosensitive ion channel family protein n=1 Tax=Loktanella sp. DJP18 TaxID=3409788 RepID=UPI003BB5909D